MSEQNSSKITYLFGPDYVNWQYPDDKYLTYVTPAGIADTIVNEANHIYELKSKVLWDMFAGIGTDAVRFSYFTGKILCSEINNDTYQSLNANMDMLNVHNVSTFKEDCSTAEHLSDIVYFDPPWGEQFVSGANFDFDSVILGKCTVTELMVKTYARCDMIIKTPFLCDTVERVVDDKDILRILTFSQQKVKFYFVKKMTVNKV